MRALVLLLALSSCSYAYQHGGTSRPVAYAAWGADLAGIVASAVAMDRAITIDDQHERIVTMSTLFVVAGLFAMSAKSALAPQRPQTAEDCAAEIAVNQETIMTAPRRQIDVTRPPSMGRCETDGPAPIGESWGGRLGPL